MSTAVDPPTEAEIRAVLARVIDPELGDDIVSLGMVRDIDASLPTVTVEVALTIASCPLRGPIEDQVRREVATLPGVDEVQVRIAVMDREERAEVMARARWKARAGEDSNLIPSTTHVLAISSGKGGVGKSSVTANLAEALAQRGYTVGVLDADIWGFSIPRMLGMDGEIPVVGGKMRPIERRVGPGVLKVLSMGFLAEEEEAIMWRGLMLNRAVQHFLEDVVWGDMDYLLVDMPPGTGDVQMGLARMLPRAEMIVVTTPAALAQSVAARVADMARRGYMRVVGVIENMSAFVADDGSEYALFGSGGGERLARDIGVPLIGQIPLDSELAAAADSGKPIGAAGNGAAAHAFAALTERIVTEVAPPIEMSGCTARILDRVEEQLDATAASGPTAPA